jgi:hypothetical protein
MNKFIVPLNDKKREKLTDELLNAHVAHLKKLFSTGRLVLCDPFKDDSSAIQIIRAKDEAEARGMAQKDPLIEHGYYASFEVKELIEANEDNNWLTDHSQTTSNLKM